MSFFKKIFGGGKKQDPPVVSKRKDEPDVYHVSGTEGRMNFAMEKARLTLGYFRKSLTAPAPHQQYFSLKARIADGERIEHIWLTDVSFDDSNIYYGKIGNEPLDVRTVKLGQQVGIAFEDVSDWMIIENGRLIGGYTIRVLREGLTGAALENFDSSVGMFIDEGVDYFEHDLSTPEGAILCLEDAYDAKDTDRAEDCKDFEAEAMMMLGRLDNLKHLTDNQDIVTQTAEVIRLSFRKHLHDGFPSFVGVSRAFPGREYIHDDLCIVTEICYHPNNTKSLQRHYVSRKNNAWRVMNLVD